MFACRMRLRTGRAGSIGRRHVDLGAQHARAVGNSPAACAGTGPGSPRRAVAIGAICRLRSAVRDTAGFPPRSDRRRRPCPWRSTSRRSITVARINPRQKTAVAPSKPAQRIPYNRLDVFDLFFGRIGVVEAQIVTAAELGSDAECEARWTWRGRLQITVRLRREAGITRPRTCWSLWFLPMDNSAHKSAAGWPFPARWWVEWYFP